MTDNNTSPRLSWVPLAIALAFIIGLWGGAALFSGRNNTGNKLSTVMQLIENRYVDVIDTDSLLEATIPDLLTHLDPHTVYIPAADLQTSNEELQGSFSGIGISFQLVQDTITVVEVISGGPAQKAGLMPGDRIVTINDSLVAGQRWTEENVRQALRGPKDSSVDVGIHRATSPDLLSYTLTRGDIPVTSIDAAYMLDAATGYVKVNKFGANTYGEFLNALLDLRYRGATQYIVDLRGNGGGFMEPAILMVNEFLPRGAIIVSTRGRLGTDDSMIGADGSGTFTDADLTVLIDEFSASASEIFAGAIQDNDRGLVVGRRSFGKGLVQNQVTLPDSSAIRLTVARYYTPSGRSIQKLYKPGHLSEYTNEVLERYYNGETFNADSMKIDHSLIFTTSTGREVYGQGGIVPDLFVPNDTTRVTSWYLKVFNTGLPQKFAFEYADRNRARLAAAKSADELAALLPADDALLGEFVEYTRRQGISPRWYYINISRPLIVNHLKALIARDLLNVAAFYEISNRDDAMVDSALNALNRGRARAPIMP